MLFTLALKVGGMDAADRVVVHSENRGGRMPPAIAKPLRPGRAAYRQKRPPPDQPQGSPHDAARMSNVGPTMVEPQGCGGAATMSQAAHRTSDQPRPSRMDAAPMRNPRTTRHVFAHAFDESRRGRATLCGPDGPHMNSNDHRRNPPRGARTMQAGLSNVGPTMVEPHGCGGAKTTPQIAHQLHEQSKTEPQDAAPVAPPNDLPTRVRAPLRTSPTAFAHRASTVHCMHPTSGRARRRAG